MLSPMLKRFYWPVLQYATLKSTETSLIITKRVLFATVHYFQGHKNYFVLHDVLLKMCCVIVYYGMCQITWFWVAYLLWVIVKVSPKLTLCVPKCVLVAIVYHVQGWKKSIFEHAVSVKRVFSDCVLWSVWDNIQSGDLSYIGRCQGHLKVDLVYSDKVR